MRVVEKDEVFLDAKGLVGDRRFMVVAPRQAPLAGEFSPGEASHRFITQRQCPMLATISAVVEDDEVSLSSALLPNFTVRVSCMPNPLATTYFGKVWDDVVKLTDMGDEVADFLQAIADKDRAMVPTTGIRLAAQALDDNRTTIDKYVPSYARFGLFGMTPPVSLNDGFPILIANEASLEELNQRLVSKGKDPISMRNFRPNIVVKGCPAFDEDTWRAIRIGNVILHVVKGCPRCKQSCTDQETGAVSEEPLETLSQYRAMIGSKENIFFAQNVTIDSRSIGKRLEVGDKVEILLRGDPVWKMSS